MKNARRNYYLGTPYTVSNIKERIRMKHLPVPYSPIPTGCLIRLVVTTIKLDAVKRQPRYSRQQKRYLHSHWRVRKMQRSAAGGSTREYSKESERLLEELDFFFGNMLFTPEAVRNLEEKEKMELALAYTRLKEKSEWFTPEEEKKILRYRELRRLQAAETDPAARSGLEGEIRKIELVLPVRDLLEKYEELEESRQMLEKKKREAARSLRILSDIKKLCQEEMPCPGKDVREHTDNPGTPLQEKDRNPEGNRARGYMDKKEPELPADR